MKYTSKCQPTELDNPKCAGGSTRQAYDGWTVKELLAILDHLAFDLKPAAAGAG
ncbi:hypothetical protein ACKA06_01905 [Rossellomorea oryzaecorticis]|uniref:Uncharacterized protein n=1 Tax=Rossellomorea oryzaecorticis TaxID=1396505 RepID=A0ABW8VQ45_9BACI